MHEVKGIGKAACEEMVNFPFSQESYSNSNSSSSSSSSNKRPRTQQNKHHGLPPIPGKGANHSDCSALPFGMHAIPSVGYSLSNPGKGKTIRVNFYTHTVVHARKKQVGKVDQKFENLEAGSRRLRQLTKLNLEPPGLRFLRFNDQQTVLNACNLPTHVPKFPIDLVIQRTEMFWNVFDTLLSEKTFSTGQVQAALQFNLEDEVMNGLVHNLTDSHDKSRFLPLPFDVRLYILCDQMLFGKLPICPKCSGHTLLGTPSGWVSCRGWENKSKDKPCTWHSDKNGESFVSRDPIMKHNKTWLMPPDCKPAKYRGTDWENVLLQ